MTRLPEEIKDDHGDDDDAEGDDEPRHRLLTRCLIRGVGGL